MPIFKSKSEPLFLVTNYKVMFSTFTGQDSLVNVKASDKRFRRSALLQKFGLNKDRFFIVVRNPYTRVESFFKDKFRFATDYYERKGKWQICQELFFPHIGVHESMSAEEIKKKLLSTDFNAYVAVLPKVFKLDPHMTPQNLKAISKFKFWRFTKYFKIPFERILQLESKSDIKFLEATFALNLNKKVNSTDLFNEKITWTSKSREIVQSLYKEDFLRFDYSMDFERGFKN